ncbi:unnamed protein product [Lepidochelys olivacea]
MVFMHTGMLIYCIHSEGYKYRITRLGRAMPKLSSKGMRETATTSRSDREPLKGSVLSCFGQSFLKKHKRRAAVKDSQEMQGIQQSIFSNNNKRTAQSADWKLLA